MSSTKETRYYSWDIITYLSEEEFVPILCEHFASWAYIYHDKDVKEDGTPKEPHFHIVGSKRNKSSFTAMLRLFDKGTQNTRFIGIKGQDEIKERYLYLDHRYEDGKYKYNASDIIVHDSYYWVKVTKDITVTRSSNDEFTDDLLAPDMLIEDMGRKYGRDFMKNVRNYLTFRDIVRFERGELSNQYRYFEDDKTLIDDQLDKRRKEMAKRVHESLYSKQEEK